MRVDAPPAGAAHGAASDTERPWHALEIPDVLTALAGSAQGLEDAEAAARLARWGPNRPEVTRAESPWRTLARQFASTVVVLLLVAAALAFAMHEWANAMVIGVVLVLDVAIGFSTEVRARRAIASLMALQAHRASLLRAGRRVELDATLVVPGDVLLLEAGMTVPADARVLHDTGLRLSEAILTGESLPVSKRAAPAVAERAPLAERPTMVYAGTAVADGAGRAIVVRTGIRTELGRVGALTNSLTSDRAPLEKRLDALGRQLGVVAVGVAAVVAAVAWLHDTTPAAVVTLFIAVAVAAIPEGLPAVVTIAMAAGAQRMARRHAVVRRLPAVETLGAVSVVCTDKTGTLTLGEMTVTTLWASGREYQVSGVGYGAEGGVTANGEPLRAATDTALARLLSAAVMVNRAELRGEGDGRAVAGDPTEGALLVAAEKAGLRRAELAGAAPEAAELPFSSERMMMATVHRRRAGGGEAAWAAAAGEWAPGALRVFVKGAPHRVLQRCAVSREERERLMEVNASLAGRGLRVLAVAAGELPAGAAVPQGVPEVDAVLHDLTLLGFVGMTDPPAPMVQATIATLRRAGIRTLMLTGDQRSTAAAVGRTLGVVGDDRIVIDGEDLDAMSDEQLAGEIERAGAISRVSPEGKLRVVRALRADGEIVAMLGDGVNDAPALRQADVGVAMGGRGSDVAREAAGVVLQDDRFDTIGSAVEEGRRIFDNIRRVVLYLLAGNLAELTIILGGAVAGVMMVTPLQILWINLVSDGAPALALAVERAAPDVMQRAPRRASEGLLPWRMGVSAVAYSAIIALATLASYRIGAGAWPVPLVSPDAPDPERGRAFAFMTLTLAQLLLMWIVRAPRRAERGARWHVFEPDDPTAVAVLGSVALQLALGLIPAVASSLRLGHLGGSGAVTVVALATLSFLAAAAARRFLRPWVIGSAGRSAA